MSFEWFNNMKYLELFEGGIYPICKLKRLNAFYVKYDLNSNIDHPTNGDTLPSEASDRKVQKKKGQHASRFF